MKNWLKWFVLAAVALFLAGCGRTSEAKVNLFNNGELDTRVTIDIKTSQLSPGQKDTFTLTWPGRDTIHVSMVFYPVGQLARSKYQDLELKHGDLLDFNVGFTKN
jgi:hypothetical protein